MSAQHTPGPWTQHEGEVWAKNYGLISRSYYGKPDGEGAANARLIAAAPDLLKALQALTHSLDYADLLHDDQRSAYANASAIIAKATGEKK